MHKNVHTHTNTYPIKSTSFERIRLQTRLTLTFIVKLFRTIVMKRTPLERERQRETQRESERERETCIENFDILQALFLEAILKSCKEFLSPLNTTGI